MFIKQFETLDHKMLRLHLEKDFVCLETEMDEEHYSYDEIQLMKDADSLKKNINNDTLMEIKQYCKVYLSVLKKIQIPISFYTYFSVKHSFFHLWEKFKQISMINEKTNQSSNKIRANEEMIFHNKLTIDNIEQCIQILVSSHKNTIDLLQIKLNHFDGKPNIQGIIEILKSAHNMTIESLQNKKNEIEYMDNQNTKENIVLKHNHYEAFEQIHRIENEIFEILKKANANMKDIPTKIIQLLRE